MGDGHGTRLKYTKKKLGLHLRDTLESNKGKIIVKLRGVEEKAAWH